jgi:hypothetical protein
MTRISNISSPNDFELENKREALRERRWQRYQSMICTLYVGIKGLVALAVLLVAAPSVLALLRWW